jgi:hypothetical protein
VACGTQDTPSKSGGGVALGYKIKFPRLHHPAL